MAAYPAVVRIEVHPADRGEPIAHALPLAQQAGLGGRQAQAVTFGEVALGLAFEIAGAQDGGILGGQFGQ